MNRCARCNWRPEDDETLAEHAEAASHPLCTACCRSLPSDRPRVCRDCQDTCTTQLREVLDMWAELPDILEQHAGENLPGGDALVLVGPGARGEQGADDPERRRLIDDNRSAPIPSVAWTLVSWADDWRHLRDEGNRERDAAPAYDALVRDSHAYLLEHAAWAAAEHWAWAEYAADIAYLHGSLLRATNRYRWPGRLGLACFACRGQLVYRVIRDEDADPAPSSPRWWVDKGVAGPVTEAEWKRRHLGTAGLEEDHATCRDCGLTYNAEALLLAQRAAVEDAQWFDDEEGERWGTVKAAADWVNRSHWSLRTWARQGLIRSTTVAGTAYVHLGDVETETERATRRARA